MFLALAWKPRSIASAWICTVRFFYLIYIFRRLRFSILASATNQSWISFQKRQFKHNSSDLPDKNFLAFPHFYLRPIRKSHGIDKSIMLK